MDDCEKLKFKLQEDLIAFRMKINEDIARTFNGVASCECMHLTRLHRATHKESSHSKYVLSAWERVMCVLVVLVLALATYIGMLVSTLGLGKNSRNGGIYF